MSLRPLRALDRSPFRPALRSLTTWYARRLTGADVEVLYEGMWIHRVGDLYCPDGPRFRYRTHRVRQWPKKVEQGVENARRWWLYRYEPKAGDTILDIGAGAGLDPLVFSRAVGPSGTVVAVEAHPQTFAAMEKFCEKNRLSNVICRHAAVADKPGQATIAGKAGSLGSRLDLDGASKAGRQAVPAITIDDLCDERSLDRIDFLKMNTEGAERLAIQGMTRSVSRIRHVCIACHDFLAQADEDWFRTRAVVVDFLREHGFDIVTRDDAPEPWVRDHVYGARD